MLIVFAAAILAYCSAALFLFARQTDFIFLAKRVGVPPPLPSDARMLEVTTGDREKLRGVLIPALNDDQRGPVVLGFGGNAWSGAAAALYLHQLYPRAPIVVFHYRGYAPSDGHASAEALLADAPLVYDRVRKKFPSRPIVAVGFSIGSGVAAHLARERRLNGLILVTPFDSLASVAGSHFPWLPVRLLLRHRIEPAEDLHGLYLPVAIIAAERDRIIPPASTSTLKGSVSNLVMDRIIAGRGHNDIYQDPRFRRDMIQALARMN